MQLSTGEAAKLFRKLDVEERRSTHHVRGWVVIDGKRAFPVHYSYGRKDMPGSVPEKFRRSLHLSVDEFRRFKECTMSRSEYHRLMRDRGFTQ